LHEPFFVDSLDRAVLEENRSIKTVSETFLCHFIRNVNYLAGDSRSSPAGECKTREIDTISLLRMPEPTIVVLNSNASIEVRNLRSIQEFKSFFLKIREGVGRFYVKPKKTSVDATPSIAFDE